MSIFSKIFRGTVANDKTGDPLREGGQIVNDNFDITEANINRIDQDVLDRVSRVDSVQNIAGLVGDYDGQQISLLGYHPESDVGGGKFYWDSTKAKSDHNGGTVIDPDKTFPSNWNNPTQVDEWFTADGAGNGVWVLLSTNNIISNKPTIFSMPDGFDFEPSTTGIVATSSIIRNSSGYEIKNNQWNPPYLSSGSHKHIYFSPSGGGSGSSLASPYGIGSLGTVLASDSTVRKATFAPGFYFITEAQWDGSIASSQCVLEVENDGIAYLIFGSDDFTFANEGGGVFSTSSAGYDDVVNVITQIIRDENGFELALDKLDSLSELNSSDSGFFLGASDLYIKPVAGTTTDDYWCIFGVGGIKQGSGSRYYYSNIEFIGGERAFHATATDCSFFMRNCAYKFAAGAGLRGFGTNIYINNINSVSYKNYGDGLTYSNNCYVIEDHCQSFGAGFNNNDTDIQNGSSLHGTCRGIRVGGFYGGTFGPVVADVHDSKSWNIGCTAINSLTPDGVPASFEAWGPTPSFGGATMWVDSCTAYDSEYGLYAHEGGSIFVRNSDISGAIFKDSIGDIRGY